MGGNRRRGGVFKGLIVGRHEEACRTDPHYVDPRLPSPGANYRLGGVYGPKQIRPPISAGSCPSRELVSWSCRARQDASNAYFSVEIGRESAELGVGENLSGARRPGKTPRFTLRLGANPTIFDGSGARLRGVFSTPSRPPSPGHVYYDTPVPGGARAGPLLAESPGRSGSRGGARLFAQPQPSRVEPRATSPAPHNRHFLAGVRLGAEPLRRLGGGQTGREARFGPAGHSHRLRV
jgi:hypothetical protein